MGDAIKSPFMRVEPRVELAPPDIRETKKIIIITLGKYILIYMQPLQHNWSSTRNTQKTCNLLPIEGTDEDMERAPGVTKRLSEKLDWFPTAGR